MRWESFKIAFTTPILIGSKKYSKKEGLLLFSKNSSGDEVCSELSPFIELHGISLVDARLEIDKLIPHLNFNLDNIDIRLPLFNLVPSLNKDLSNISAASLYCLETLALKLFPNELNFNNLNPVKINGLFIPGYSKIKNSLPKVLKVKIGRLNSETEKKALKELIDSGYILRPDGNRSFSNNDLTSLMRSIPAKSIDYLEEPLKDIKEWNLFSSKHPFMMALDENLESYLNNKIEINHDSIKAWVIKPSVHYSISGCIKLIDRANKENIQLIVSSSFETSVGLIPLLYLANLQDKNKPTYHGLDTLKYLSSDLGPTKLVIENNQILPV